MAKKSCKPAPRKGGRKTVTVKAHKRRKPKKR